MASTSLTVRSKKDNKNPQSARIVLLAAPHHPIMAIVCVATGLPCPTAYFGDRASNAFPFLNPYIGALFAYNLESMKAQTNTVDASMPERLYPGASDRMLPGIKNKLTRGKGDEKKCTYDVEHVEQLVACIKGRPGPHTKFIEALARSITSGPMVWSPDTTSPFLPISMALDAKCPWFAILPALTELVERSEAFIKEWGWHGAPLKLSGKGLHEKRQKRRLKKTKPAAEEDQCLDDTDD